MAIMMPPPRSRRRRESTGLSLAHEDQAKLLENGLSLEKIAEE
jgi:hypothetical protein